MGLRKASVYKRLERPYTRKSKVKKKAYIKTIPPKHIAKFVTGNTTKFERGGYPFVISFISKENAQVRDNALEASRQLIHRHLERKVGKDYYLALVSYPHQILREHKQAAMAQADRMFAGMKHAFGKPLSIAAVLRQDSKIFVIGVNTRQAAVTVRKILDMAKSKIGCKTAVVVEEINKK